MEKEILNQTDQTGETTKSTKPTQTNKTSSPTNKSSSSFEDFEGFEGFEGFTIDDSETNRKPNEQIRDLYAQKQAKELRAANHKKIKRQQTREKAKKVKKIENEKEKEMLDKMTEEERNNFFDQRKQKFNDVQKNLEKGLKEGQKIIFDLDYTNDMSIKELKSLSAQIAICYNLNKKISQPWCYNLCNYSDENKTEFEIMGARNWKMNIFSESLLNLDFIKDKNKLIYLSPDSDEVLEDFENEDIFVIGGFVDKTVMKNRTYHKASGLEITVKRLPLQEYIKQTNFNPILNINTVVEILANFKELKDWQQSIDKALPGRFYKKDFSKKAKEEEID